MAISTIGTDGLASSAVTNPKLASGVPSTAKLPAGTVLQVVNATTSTAVTSSSSTYADTNLTATITPTSTTSKILVVCMNNGGYKTAAYAGAFLGMRLMRNSTVLNVFEYGAGYNNALQDNWFATTGFNFLDSPATTSAVTYKTQFANIGNAGVVALQGNSATSAITLMEIAA